ncbi:MAG TPA: UpxY family transcription antiterminator [Terriglobales bacterium]|nr:UpxY family transcription antiterminator [Terriglobales bacterium]
MPEAPVNSDHVSKETEWYAVQTRAKHERKVGAELQRKSITTYVPTIREVHRWSDRRAVVDVPLFPCYAFIRASLTATLRLATLQTAGVLKFVGFNKGPAPIPDSQMDSVVAVLSHNVPFSSCGFITVGKRVRIRGGALDGVEGVLVGRNGDRRLIVSIELIQQSLEVVIEGYDVEPV